MLLQIRAAQNGYKCAEQFINWNISCLCAMHQYLIRNTITQCIIRSASSFEYGEILLAVNVRKDSDHRKIRSKLLFKLKENGKLKTNRIVPRTYDSISHSVIVGCSPTDIFTTRKGYQITVKRPSLEEFILLMPRKANIMYPKDMWASIGMMNISMGSKVIEAGSGSGAFTLLLSHAGLVVHEM